MDWPTAALLVILSTCVGGIVVLWDWAMKRATQRSLARHEASRGREALYVLDQVAHAMRRYQELERRHEAMQRQHTRDMQAIARLLVDREDELARARLPELTQTVRLSRVPEPEPRRITR